MSETAIAYEHRPMELHEVREVERLISGQAADRAFDRLWLAARVTLVGGVCALVAWIVGKVVAAQDSWRFAGTGFVAAVIVVAWRRPRSLRIESSLLAKDRDLGEVQLMRVQPRDVASVPGGFFLDVGDGDVLYLCGRYLHEPLRARLFPNRDFTLVRLPHSKVILDIECHGRPMGVTTPPPGPPIDLERITDGAILHARLTTLGQDVASIRVKGWK